MSLPHIHKMSSHELTRKKKRAANCKVIHGLYDIKPFATFPAEIIITSDNATNYRAFFGRILPGGTGVAITIESATCPTTAQALEHLYRVSCFTLTRCRAATKSKGGKLGEWKFMPLGL